MNVILLTEKRELLRERTSLLEQKISKLNDTSHNISPEELNYYREIIEQEKSRFFPAGETDPYKFGIDIKKLLEKEHLTIKNYRTIEQDNHYLIEFSLSGSSYNFFNFLKNLYDRNLNYTFPYFTVKNEKYGLDASFRIGYVLND